MLTIPTWALPLVLTLFLAVLGFAWRLAARAERLTDKLDTIVERLGALDARIAAITTLETSVTEIRAELRSIRQELTHAQALSAKDLATLELRLAAIERRVSPC